MPAVTADALTPLQAAFIGLALIVTFVATVFVAGFLAKKLKIEDADYARALWATLFANLASGALNGALTTYLDLPIALILVVAGVVAPIVVFRLVFQCTLALAALLWLLVLIAEVVIGVALVAASLGLAQRLAPVEGLS